MIKWMIVALAVMGALFAIRSYAPGLWVSGFHVPGVHFQVLWAYVILAGVVYFGAKLKLGK